MNTWVEQVDGSKVKPLGRTAPLNLNIYNRTFSLAFYVLSLQAGDILLGLDWFFQSKAILNVFENKNTNINDQIETEIDKDLGWDLTTPNTKLEIDESELSKLEVSKIKEFVNSLDEFFANSWKDLGCCNLRPYKIKLKSDVPIFNYPYRMSEKELKLIDEETQKMLDAGIIRASMSPYSARPFFGPKPNGEKRFVINYKPLNSVTEIVHMAIPAVEDLINKLNKAKWFTILDLKSGYWQIVVDIDSVAYTAFTTRTGHWEFVRLPFGLSNAVSEFCHIMHMLLGHLPYVIVYVDDIVIFSESLDDHFEHILNVCKILRKNNLKLNKDKCKFFKLEIKCLGYIISHNRVAMDIDKIKTICLFREPKNLKQLQSFLGLSNYYAKFIQNYASIVYPLFKLLKKNCPFIWTNVHAHALEEIKKALTSYPTLRMVDSSKKFRLYTDASSFALGAILSQYDDKEEWVVYYISRVLKGAEINYTITEKEALSVVWSIKYFRIYLIDTKFEVITDHSALIWLMNIKEPSGRLMRWSIYLQQYDFIIIHRSGKKHLNADAVSRLHYSESGELCVVDKNTFCLTKLLREILVSTRANSKTDLTTKLDKLFEVYDDKDFIHFLKYKKFFKRCDEKNKQRIKNVAKFFEIKDNRLVVQKDLNKDILQIIPKKNERLDLIKIAHDYGHYATESTVDRIESDGYTWFKIYEDVKEYVSKCIRCHKFNSMTKFNAPAQALPVKGIFDRIGIDLVLGLPLTVDGYKGILVITEYLSKFPYAVPIRSKTADEIAEKLWTYISIFGPAKEIISDNGSEFINKVIDRLLAFSGIERRITSKYSPATNGLTERFNATLIKSLSKHAYENPQNWPEWLPFILLSYRTRVHSITGFTPFFLCFGRECNTFTEYNGFETNNILELSKRMIQLNKLKTAQFQLN